MLARGWSEKCHLLLYHLLWCIRFCSHILLEYQQRKHCHLIIAVQRSKPLLWQLPWCNRMEYLKHYDYNEKTNPCFKGQGIWWYHFIWPMTLTFQGYDLANSYFGPYVSCYFAKYCRQGTQWCFCFQWLWPFKVMNFAKSQWVLFVLLSTNRSTCSSYDDPLPLFLTFNARMDSPILSNKWTCPNKLVCQSMQRVWGIMTPLEH